MKNTNKMITLAMTALISASAFSFAATENKAPELSKQGQHIQRIALTDAQKAKIQEQKDKNQQVYTKWNALTEAQKKEVYAIDDEIFQLQLKKVDKLVSLGVMDKATGNQIKANITKKQQEIKNNGYVMGTGSNQRTAKIKTKAKDYK